MWIMFDFKPDYMGKPCVCVRACVHVFKTLVEQLCLDGILTMTFNAEACGLHGWHAGKRLPLWTFCSARVLWPNLRKCPERVCPQQDYAKPKPSGCVFHLYFLYSVEPTTLWEMLNSQQPCCVPVSEVLKCQSEIWPVSIKSQCFIKIDLV